MGIYNNIGENDQHEKSFTIYFFTCKQYPWSEMMLPGTVEIGGKFQNINCLWLLQINMHMSGCLLSIRHYNVLFFFNEKCEFNSFFKIVNKHTAALFLFVVNTVHI